MIEAGGTDVGSKYRITIEVPLALREHLNAYFARDARARKRAGEAIRHSESKGAGRFLVSALHWLSSLSDDDLRRIRLEGERLRELVEALDPDCEGPLPYSQRSKSILAPGPPGTGTDTTGDVPVRHLGGTRGERLHGHGGGQATGQQEARGRGRKDPAVAAGKP